MKLLIAIPALDYINNQFAQCLIDLTEQLNRDRVPHEVKILCGTLVYIARDKLAKHAINNGFTHVLWLDADMIFTPSIFNDLFDAGKEITCAVFHSRRPPYVSAIFSGMNPITRVESYPIDLFRVEACGMACVLMTVDVLERVCLANDGMIFLPMADLGEDLAFCQRARRLGIEIWCDGAVRVGHIGHTVIYPDDHELYMERLNHESIS